MNKGSIRALLLVGALLVIVLAVGGAKASARRASATYVCAYGRRFKPLGTVYWRMTVSPKGVGPTFCSAFNGGFRGKRFPAGKKLGTGTAYCRYKLKQSGYVVVGAVYADKKSTGQAFCKIYHPSGWKRS